ncbi:competence protein ComEC [[Clostridium] innocuum]|nr:competence protein ComEC [[Clostridium] innocuum]
MRQSWLPCGWCCLILLWAHWISFWFSLFLCLLMFVYYRRHFVIQPLFIVILMLVQVRMGLLLRAPSMPQDTIVQVREIKTGYVIARVNGQDVLVYGLTQAGYNDVLQIKGTYAKTASLHNFHQFYFPDWLKKRRIHYQLQAESYKLIQKGSGLRHDLYAHIQAMEDKEQRTWLSIMLYGIRDEEASYFLTASGLHIATLAMLLSKLLQLFVSQMNASLLILVLLGVCGHVTVFSSSLLRILIFRSVSICCHKWNVQDRLGISMTVLLLLFPYMAWELAFLLPLGFRMLAIFNVQKRGRYVQSLLLLIPMQFLFFTSCNPFQLLLFPLFRYAYAFLYACCLASLLLPYIGFSSVIVPAAQVLEAVQQWGVTLYYTPQLLWLYLWIQSSAKLISYVHRKPVFTLLVLFVYAPFSSYLNPFGEVLMIDVGQGDCTLITLPFHQGAVMIDIMGSRYRNIPKEVVVPIVKAKGYQKLDALILTHDDFDHSGGKEQLLQELAVARIVDTKKTAVPLKGFPLAFLLTDYQGTDTNDNSIITYMQTETLDALFMGDAGSDAEEALLQCYELQDVHVLKAGHHGSSTSSSPAFLHALQPQLALISAGRNNRYHHPSSEVLQRMQQERIHPLVSAWDGAISIRFTPWFSYYVSAEGTLGILDAVWR